MLDDGVRTPLGQKSDGIINLAEIAHQTQRRIRCR